ncbi:MAG: diguanylate cyclase domain-containing protein [Bacillota bacterium]
MVGRYSQEEFLLLLPQTDARGALALAERLRRLFDEHVFAGGIRFTPSLGICTLDPSSGFFPPERLRDRNLVERVLEEILLRAGEALLKAKEESTRTAAVTVEGLPDL